jgi:hypothetical protein
LPERERKIYAVVKQNRGKTRGLCLNPFVSGRGHL